MVEILILRFSFGFQLNEKGSVPHTRPVTPRSVTHNHDEDYSDEDSDPNNKSDEEKRRKPNAEEEEEEEN